jgi:hypothetical protein
MVLKEGAARAATIHVDEVFAPLDRDHDLERIGGGNETEVYRTDDGRFVVKLKGDTAGPRAAALARARAMRAVADELVAWLGPAHTIPSLHIVARDRLGRVEVVVIQPYVGDGCPLYDVDWAALDPDERDRVADQLVALVRRSRELYRHTGHLPDLYGRTSASAEERRRLNRPGRLPWRLWSFLVARNLLRSHNLMLTNGPERRVVLIDYDRVRRRWLYRSTYYAARRLLFWRDLALIALMRRGFPVPGGARGPRQARMRWPSRRTRNQR